MIKKIQNFCFQHKLLFPGQALIVGVSGGPDSTALVCFLNRLKKSWRLKVRLVHVNYALRGKDSLRDEKFCLALAEKFYLPISVKKYIRKGEKTGNLEENLRNFRYAAFEKERIRWKFDGIAVGHTLDDRVETFLFNLIRGSGLEGLVSLKPKNGRIIRPLLGLEKKEILLFLEKEKQSFRKDKSNDDLKFFRNKIRHDLLVKLEKEYNPRIKKSLTHFQEHLEETAEWLAETVNKSYPKIVKEAEGLFFLDREKYAALPGAIRRGVFRQLMAELKGDFRNFSANHFWELEKIVFSQKSKEQNFSYGGISVKKEKNKLVFAKKR